MKPLTPIATANIEHSQTPKHINIKPYTECLLTLVFIIPWVTVENFPKLMTDTKPQTQKLENTKQNKYQKI